MIRTPLLPTLLGLGLLVGLTAPADAQTQMQRHIDAARAAAGEEHISLFQLLCPMPPATPDNTSPMPQPPSGLRPRAGAEPWRTDPVRVFDNLFYVGQTEYSAWAVDTGDGLIVIDALFDYSAEGSIADGLRELGYDPADIEYLIVSHGHGDHVGGAAHIQETYGARVVMSEADWDLVARSTADWAKPTRDIVAEDGQQIRLGDVTVTLYVTPGHTPGTLSSIVEPIRDGSDVYTAAAWGGTAFNFRGSAEFPRDYWLRVYGESATRFKQIVEDANAEVLIANHPRFDRTPRKVAALATRRAGERHPYVIGNEMVQRYLTIAEECSAATRLAEG